MPATWSWVDLVVLAIVLVSAIEGLKSGLIRSVFSLVGLLLGVTVASWEYRSAAANLMPWFHQRPLAELVGFIAVALLVMIAAGLVGWVVKKLVHWVGLGWLDRALGLVFGALRGGVLVTLAVMAIVAFYPQEDWMSHSWLEHRFLEATETATNLTSGEMRARVLNGLDALKRNSPEILRGKLAQP